MAGRTETDPEWGGGQQDLKGSIGVAEGDSLG